jgi:hypothetical protein
MFAVGPTDTAAQILLWIDILRYHFSNCRHSRLLAISLPFSRLILRIPTQYLETILTKETIGHPESDDERASGSWDHAMREEFYRYYAEASVSPEALSRFRRLRDRVLGILGRRDPAQPLDVVDIGCGAGTLCRIWAEAGHRVAGLDCQRAADRFGARACYRRRIHHRFPCRVGDRAAVAGRVV